MTQDQHTPVAADEPGAAPTQNGTDAAGVQGQAPPEPSETAAGPIAAAAADGDDADDDDAYEDSSEEVGSAGTHGYIRFRTPVFAVIGTLLSLALLALIAGNVYQFVHNRDTQVIATVNGSKITQSDFVRDDANSQQTLDDLIANKLVLQEAGRQKVNIPNSQIDGQIATIKKQLGTEKDFQAALTSNNLTESELRDRIRISLIEQQLGAKGVVVSDDEAQTYYNQNKTQFGTQTFDQSKDQIKAQLLQQKQGQAVQTWIAGLRKNAKVDIHLPS